MFVLIPKLQLGNQKNTVGAEDKLPDVMRHVIKVEYFSELKINGLQLYLQ